MAVDMLVWESHYRGIGLEGICGIDEAGRGPLAGPVVAAAVAFDEQFDCAGIDDSKKLPPKAREQHFARLSNSGCRVGVGIADVECIDRVNILQATYIAMRAALARIEGNIDVVLVDGRPVPNLSHHRQHAIIGGDACCASIAAASIVAKVTRDRIMVEYDAVYPEYGFASHKGYSAEVHLMALRRHGPCPIHRKSFAPVAAVLCGAGAQSALDLGRDIGRI